MLFFASPSSSQSASQNASSRGSLRLLFRLPHHRFTTASSIASRSGEQLVGTLCRRSAGLFTREAPRAAAYSGRQHRRDNVSTRSENFSVPASADGSMTMKDCRCAAVALLGEKRIAPLDRRAGERGADQLEHQREHRALRAADRNRLPSDRLFRSVSACRCGRAPARNLSPCASS